MKPVIRQKVNTVIDIVMFVVMVALAVIGFLIRYTLLSGAERWERFGRNMDMTFLGLDRHEWGDIHLIFGFSLAVLLVLHIVFHWTQIVCMFKSLFLKKKVMVTATFSLMVLCIAIMLAPFVFSPEIGEPIRGQGEGYGQTAEIESERGEEAGNGSRVEEQQEREKATLSGKQPAHEEDRTLEIKGYHTISGLARTYRVSVSAMKQRLNIPASVSDNERLGRIRRIYGFSMREVEDCILALQRSEEER